MSNVVTLPGCPDPIPAGEPVPTVVAMLEALVEMARDGKLRSIRAVGGLADGTVNHVLFARAGVADDHYQMLGALEALKDQEKGR